MRIRKYFRRSLISLEDGPWIPPEMKLEANMGASANELSEKCQGQPKDFWINLMKFLREVLEFPRFNRSIEQLPINKSVLRLP